MQVTRAAMAQAFELLLAGQRSAARERGEARACPRGRSHRRTRALARRGARWAKPGPRCRVDLRSRVDALETELVLEALAKTKYNQTRAAHLLGLSRFGLQKMMKRLQIKQEP